MKRINQLLWLLLAVPVILLVLVLAAVSFACLFLAYLLSLGLVSLQPAGEPA